MEPVEFGDYELIKKLAAGGMGEVFLARQLQGAGFERYVAIKRILPDLSTDEEFVRMFLDEARLAAQLNHPHVVEIYDLGICGDQYFIAMEFLEGRDLRRVMSRLAHRHRALPGAHAIQVIYGAAEGLHYAHELTDPSGEKRNIIHRDVSPQNIFISFHGGIKVLDFGIAKAETRSVRTRTGGLKGKYPYMSPEQVRGETVDRRSDLFSLGVILWEVTVGRRLFRRDNDLLTLNAVLKCEVPKPSALMDRYPPELEQIVMRALAKDPEDRYSTCRDMQEDLEQFMGQYGLILSPQKLGKSVKRLFSDEPATVQDILDSAKKKPKSKSLLFDEAESSSSRSAVPNRGSVPDETSETSSPSRASGERGSQSIPGVGGVPLEGFGSADGSDSSDLSPSPSAQSFVPVSWDAEAEPAVLTDEELSVEVDVDGEVEQVGNVAPSADEDAVTPAVIDVSELATGLGIKHAPEDEPRESDGPGSEPPAPDPSSRPESVEGAELPEVIDKWVADAPTALHTMDSGAFAKLRDKYPSEAPLDDEEALFHAKPADVPDLVGGPSDETATTSPVAPQPQAKLPPIFFVAAGVALLVLFGLMALVVSLMTRSCGEGAARQDSGARAGIMDPGTPLPPPLPPTRPDAASPPPRPIDVGPPPTRSDAAPTPPGPVDVGPPPTRSDAAVVPPPPGPPSDGGGATPSPTKRDGSPSGGGQPTYRVSLSTVPSGLTLYVGGRRLGTSPTRPHLQSGRHSVRVRSKSRGIDFTRTIRVPSQDGHSETISVPQGTLALRIRPYAVVFVDGRRLGLTPMQPVRLYIGRHRVRLVNESLSRSVSRSVTIRPNKRTVLDVNLADGS